MTWWFALPPSRNFPLGRIGVLGRGGRRGVFQWGNAWLPRLWPWIRPWGPLVGRNVFSSTGY